MEYSLNTEIDCELEDILSEEVYLSEELQSIKSTESLATPEKNNKIYENLPRESCSEESSTRCIDKVTQGNFSHNKNIFENVSNPLQCPNILHNEVLELNNNNNYYNDKSNITCTFGKEINLRCSNLNENENREGNMKKECEQKESFSISGDTLSTKECLPLFKLNQTQIYIETFSNKSKITKPLNNITNSLSNLQKNKKQSIHKENMNRIKKIDNTNNKEVPVAKSLMNGLESYDAIMKKPAAIKLKYNPKNSSHWQFTKLPNTMINGTSILPVFTDLNQNITKNQKKEPDNQSLFKEVLDQSIKKKNSYTTKCTKDNTLYSKEILYTDKFDNSDDSEGELQIDESPMPANKSELYDEINHSRDINLKNRLSTEKYQQVLLNQIQTEPLNKFTTARNNRKSSYTDLDLHEAIASVINERLRPAQAISLYGIPRRTFFRRLGVVRNILGIKSNRNYRSKSSKTLHEDTNQFCDPISTFLCQGHFMADSIY